MNTSTSSSSSITALVPGGVVTTQNISTVIKPKENNNSMQFVKIQTPELSKSAVEQIRVAEESKISKNKIKEVEEEWQSNLLNWKSKRRQQFVTVNPNDNEGDELNNNGQAYGRKIKTFAEMIEQRAKTGNRLNFHLQRYIGSDDSQDEHSQGAENVESHNRNNISAESGDQADEENDHTNLINRLDLRDQEAPPTDEHVVLERKDSSTRDTQIDLQSVDRLQQQKNRGFNRSDSNSSLEDDDRSEVKEQKHLQRVAFVAKLKAFERMTQPTMHEPKFVPTKLAKQPPPPPLPAKQQSPAPLLTRQLSPITLSTTQSPVQIPSKQQQSSTPIPANQSSLVSDSINQLSPVTRPRKQLSPVSQPKDPVSPMSQRSEPMPQATHPIQQTSPVTQTKEQVSPISHFTDQESPVLYPKRHVSPVPFPKKELLPPASLSPNKQPSPEPLPPKQQPAAPRHHIQPRQSLHTNNNQQILPRVSQQPPSHPLHQQHQPPPPTHPHPHLHPHKEDKAQDRTVLSVSGKKRCSSCKEELGRGAAAFVIESLNLVYHTNCFRCSVCHVNLSNGFRGVDVRVHAGALHCQNCYSKDGLNYSRV